MQKRQDLIERHRKLMEICEKVKDELSTYPNVLHIGVGIKETGGAIMDEGCIKVIVSEKVAASKLGPEQIIPNKIAGISTDIIAKGRRILLGTCTEDAERHRPLRGGMRITHQAGDSFFQGGTIGCFARLNSDNSWVILSNEHVLYLETGSDGDKIGQPFIAGCCCCEANVVADNVKRNVDLDCAVARIREDVPFENTILDIGDIQGIAEPVSGERVRKRGSRTGLTSGKIITYVQSIGLVQIRPNPDGGPPEDPGGCTISPEANEFYLSFADHGDSGSVVVNDNNEIIALLNAIRPDQQHPLEYKTEGYSIDKVKDALEITIPATGDGAVGRVNRSSQRKLSTAPAPLQDTSWIGLIEKKLQATKTGTAIKRQIDLHKTEVLQLVNKRRPVTLAWQRKKGPAFLAALGRSVKNPAFQIPDEIEGITRQSLLMSMAAELEEHGSPELKQAIQQYAIQVIDLSRKGNSIRDYFAVLEQIDQEANLSEETPIT